MSEVLDAGPPPASAGDPGDTMPDRAGRASSGTWRVSWSGLRTVATLELRQRVRSTRWIVVLAVWAALLVGLAAMIHYALHRLYDATAQGSPAGLADLASRKAGAMMFGLTILLVLSLGALVAPALSATSVNGDRTAGVLATLQTTLLSPAEIALGKLAASWVTALAFLAAASPVLAWAYLDGGTPVTRLVTSVALLALTLLVVCAIGLGWSAATARTTSSAVLTYLSVAFLGLGLPVLFALSLPMTQETVKTTVTRYESSASGNGSGGGGGNTVTCVQEIVTGTVTHSERVWWILAPNPFVVIADASPRPTDLDDEDVLSALRTGVREMRLGQDPYDSGCAAPEDWSRHEAARRAQREALGATWPYGLAIDLALGIAFTVVAVLRLRTPSGRLPRNVRVA